MSKKIDRTGEEKINNFRSKMVITEYRIALDIDVFKKNLYICSSKNKYFIC